MKIAIKTPTSSTCTWKRDPPPPRLVWVQFPLLLAPFLQHSVHTQTHTQLKQIYPLECNARRNLFDQLATHTDTHALKLFFLFLSSSSHGSTAELYKWERARETTRTLCYCCCWLASWPGSLFQRERRGRTTCCFGTRKRTAADRTMPVAKNPERFGFERWARRRGCLARGGLALTRARPAKV